MMNRIASRILPALFLLAPVLTLAGETDKTKADILQLSGVKNGLCVQLGCEDEKLLVSMAQGKTFLAHGVAANEAKAESIRKALSDAHVTGFASAEAMGLDPLPFRDNLVNLLVASDLPSLVKKGLKPTEIPRVLRPKSVACLGVPSAERASMETVLKNAGIKDFKFEQKSRLWLVIKKPRPAEMDDWSHYNHGPDGNIVSKDRILERPNQMQWIAGPHWGTHRTSGVPGRGGPQGVRSVNGRNFYIMGSQLVARDAFNGIMLWADVIKGLKNNLVVAAGDEVYLPKGGEIVALDGDTGKKLRSYGKAQCRGLMFAEGVLLSFESKGFKAFEAATGKMKWSHEGGAGSPKVVGNKIVFGGREGFVCKELATGKTAWTKNVGGDVGAGAKLMFTFDEKLLFCAGGNRFTAISAKDGSKVWQETAGKARKGPPLTFFAAGHIWIEQSHNRKERKTDGFHNPKGGVSFKWLGMDPKTGKVSKTFLAPVWLRYRCHGLYATDRFLVGNRPIYFTEWGTGKVTRFEATRLGCGSICGLGHGMFYGFYANSNKCMCIRSAMSGITAFASDHKTIDGTVQTVDAGRFVKGPASAPDGAAAPSKDEWPMYRSDMSRSSNANVKIPGKDLAVLWQKKLTPGQNGGGKRATLQNDWILNRVAGDTVTAPTVAGGKVFVSLTHTPRVLALDEKSGEVAWTFEAPTRLDAPPTIYRGLALIGCSNGWVYCLRADNGKLVWRFRAAPTEQRMVAYGQVESVWPVVGGVLIAKNVAYVLAGRTTEADGGLYVHALEPKTGNVLWSERRHKPDDGPIGAWNLRGNRNDYFGPSDLLNSDGKSLSISGHRGGRFDLKTGKRKSHTYRVRIGWMMSRYARDNHGVEYPPLACAGRNTVRISSKRDKKTKKRSTSVVLAGKGGWSTPLSGGVHIESFAIAGDTASRGDSGPRPIVRVKALDTPPKIDGVIDECYTKHGTPLKYSFLNGARGKPKEATTCYMVSDKENLYLAFRCEKPNPDKVVCKKTKRDDNIWQDECVEFFLDPTNKREMNYFHLMVNPAGVTQESRNKSDASWNPNIEVKSGKEAGKAWIAEFKIPFAELRMKGRKMGHIWSLNLNRSARAFGNPSNCEDTAWAPTDTNSSHVPSMFGYAWFDALEGGNDEAAYASWARKFQPPPAAAKKPTSNGSASAVLAAVSTGGRKSGELWVLSAEDGSKAGTYKLPAGVAFDGMAVARKKVFVSLVDGSVICLGER